jgi:hypothetical protein
MLAEGDAADGCYRESIDHSSVHPSAPSWPVLISYTANGWGARAAASTHANN